MNMTFPKPLLPWQPFTFQYSKPKIVGYSEITTKLITTSENSFNRSNQIYFIKHQKQQLDNFLEKYSCIIYVKNYFELNF